MIPTPAAPALARTLMTRFPHADDYPHRSWSYPQGLLLWGMARLYERTGQAVYRDYIFDYVDHHVDAQGRVARFAGDSMDDVMTGSILVWAWRQTQDPRYLAACRQVRAAFADYPRNDDGGFWHGKSLPYEMWVDGVFMGQMFMTQYGAYVEDGPACFDEAARQLTVIYDRCRKGDTGLLHHAYSQDRKASWADPLTGCSPEVWSEGLGWYALILAETLAVFPQDHPARSRLERQFAELAASLAACQKDNGLWCQVVDRIDDPANWQDSSGSAMFTYAIERGVLLGLLPADPYAAVARRGYRGVLGNCSVNDQGLIDIKDACEGLCVQDAYDIYIHYPRKLNAQEAVAASLWAFEIMER